MSRERIGQDTWEAGHGPDRRLALCPACRRDFVGPVLWDERGDTSWWMTLRCGACETTFDLLATSSEVEAFCRELDRALDGFERGAARLQRERVEAEIEIFATALALDLISGDDFATRDGSLSNPARS